MYFVKAPNMLKCLYPKEFVWQQVANDTVYLSFDDGPHPIATPFVLEELAKYDAQATFSCIGKNVVEYPQIYQRIRDEGHAIGNHTHNHLNGWKTSIPKYLDNIKSAEQFIDSKLFRPPYGRIKPKQAKLIAEQGFKVIMWDVLCGDFDTELSPERCWEHIALNIEPGSIVVFHDSSKAWERMKYALPLTLAFCQQKKWKMKGLG